VSLLFGPHCHNEAAQSHFPYPFIRIHPLIRITNTRPTTVQMDGKKAIIMCMRDKERPSLFFHKLMQAHVKHHVQRLAAALTRRQVLYLLLLINSINIVCSPKDDYSAKTTTKRRRQRRRWHSSTDKTDIFSLHDKRPTDTHFIRRQPTNSVGHFQSLN